MVKNYLRQIEEKIQELQLGKITDLRPLGKGMESKNFFLVVASQKYILKRYKNELVDEIKYELDILNLLKNKSKRFPIPVGDIFYIQKKPCVLYKYISGKNLRPSQINENVIKKIAYIQASMHIALKGFKSKGNRERFSIFDLKFIDTFKYHCSSRNLKIIRSEAEKLEHEFTIFRRFKLPKTIIHEDLTTDNILVNNSGKITIIDFGESHNAEIISDISTAIKELIIKHNGVKLNLIKHYIYSYNRANPVLDYSQLKMIYPLLRRRTLFMLVYFLYKQSNDNHVSFHKEIETEIKILELLKNNKATICSFVESLSI